jgi:hypothetical protein
VQDIASGSTSVAVIRRGTSVGALPVIHHYRNVWSAVEMQAKSEGGHLVCANVFGLEWSCRPRAMMESARSLPM